MDFKATASSFVSSVLFALLPALTAGAFWFFMKDNSGKVIIIGSVLMVLLSVLLLVQALFVHLQRVHVDDRGFRLISPLGQTQIEWSEVASAVLRERKNAATRTDHLLVLRGRSAMVMYNTAILSPENEDSLLEFVRGKVNLVVEKDKASV